MRAQIVSITFLLVAVHQVISVQEVSSVCNPGDPSLTNQFGTNCYSYNRVHGTWKNSADLCSHYSETLTKIDNDLENNAITKWAGSYLDATYDKFWIGCSDQQKHGTFVWADGTPCNYTKWQNNFHLEDRHCVAVLFSTGEWVTDDCSTTYQFVCNYKGHGGGGPTGAPFTCPPCPTCK